MQESVAIQRFALRTQINRLQFKIKFTKNLLAIQN